MAPGSRQKRGQFRGRISRPTVEYRGYPALVYKSYSLGCSSGHCSLLEPLAVISTNRVLGGDPDLPRERPLLVIHAWALQIRPPPAVDNVRSESVKEQQGRAEFSPGSQSRVTGAGRGGAAAIMQSNDRVMMWRQEWRNEDVVHTVC